VLTDPTPHRDLDITALPTEILNPPTLEPAHPASETSGLLTTFPVLPLLPAGPALRTHLYPMAAALPEEYQLHPLTLLPEIQGVGAYIADVLSSSATLVQVVLLLRAAVSPRTNLSVRPSLRASGRPLERRSDQSNGHAGLCKAKLIYQRSPSSPAYRPLTLPTLSRSLPPFLIPLLMRILARRLRNPASTVLLAQHHATHDKRLLAQAFLTGPMWIGWTRPKIQSWVEWLEKWPLIGMVAGLGEGYLPLVDDYVYCGCDRGLRQAERADEQIRRLDHILRAQ
jgi:peroxin-16